MSTEERAQPVFDYELHEAGWATATLRLSQDQMLAMRVSYMHDSLRALARALLALDRDGREIAVPFIEEPGVHQLVMRRPDEDRLEIEVRHFQDWVIRWPPPADAESELRARGVVRWRTFRGCVASVLQRIWREYGADGYLARWKAHAFPIEELRSLEAGHYSLLS